MPNKIINLYSHIHYLKWHIFRLASSPITRFTYPEIFEYYSAIYMSKRHQSQFHVWKHIDMNKKKKEGFPVMDMGIDVSDPHFNHIVQSKYYRANNMITYGKLATFLSTPLLTGKSVKMTLIRTEHSLIDHNIECIIIRGDLEDVVVNNKQFLQDVELIKDEIKKSM
jgi:hypothetical protein